MSENLFSKKCDICGVQPAVLFFRTFNSSSQNIQESGLCPKCALYKFSNNEAEFLDLEDNKEIVSTLNQMRHILSDIVGFITHNASEKSTKELCPLCKMSLKDIQETKTVGCNQCYTHFHDFISNYIYQIGYGSKHLGQIPSRYRKYFLKNIELEKLTIKLQNLIREEKYEEAAKINKRIIKLKTNQIIF